MMDFLIDYLGLILVIVLTILLTIVIIVNTKNKAIVMSKKQKRRFKYLDTFYCGYTSVGDYIKIILHVVQDVDSSKIYAFANYSGGLNASVDFKLHKMNVKKGTGFFWNYKKLNFNDCGDFWIDEELHNFYSRDGDIIKLYSHEFKYGGNYNNKNDDGNLWNYNPNYDISLLDKATFIHGTGKFDD